MTIQLISRIPEPLSHLRSRAPNLPYQYKLCKYCIYFNKKTENCEKYVNVSLINGNYQDSNGELLYPKAEFMRESTSYCCIGASQYIYNPDSE